MKLTQAPEPSFLKGKHVFYSILNMGLGHATRSLPVVQALLNAGAVVSIGSSGRALHFLKQEVPDAHFLELPDYRLQYDRQGVRLTHLLKQLPVFFRQVGKEKKVVSDFCQKFMPDLIISDHRYGSYVQDIPSLMLCHQLRFIAPAGFRAFEFVGEWFNRFYFRNFQKVLIPDLKEGGQGYYSGRLSRVKNGGKFYRHVGILSSLQEIENPPEEPIDVLISISGPEPQRTVFETNIRRQLPELPGRIVVLLGKPEGGQVEYLSEKITIYPHVSRKKMAALFRQTQLVVSRSGYSTIMELAALGKKALLIPTPGQTEQEYLARHLSEKQLFAWKPQKELNLRQDLEAAALLPGPEGRGSVGQSVDNILIEIREALGKKTELSE
ncbi:MAG: glycosyltransferase [Calditrichia bacterium]